MLKLLIIIIIKRSINIEPYACSCSIKVKHVYYIFIDHNDHNIKNHI